MKTRTCRKCYRLLLFGSYYVAATKANSRRRSRVCKSCHIAITGKACRDNPEIYSRRLRLWRQAHPWIVKETRRKWRARNSDRESQRTRQWKMDNPIAATVSARVSGHKRRTEVTLTSDGSITLESLLYELEKQNWKCAVTGADLHIVGFHLDHIWPLSRGGEHILPNVHFVAPLTNMQKHANIPWEFCYAIPRCWYED